MLNPVLRKNIVHKEIRDLYERRLKLENRAIFREVASQIQQIRASYRIALHRNVDPLFSKLYSYGNSGGWYMNQIRILEQELFRNKRVSDEFLGQWRSIEFELIFKSQQCESEFIAFIRKEGLRKQITIKDDGSICRNGNDEYGVEKEVVVTYRLGNESEVEKVCDFLATRAYVNKSCGTHVHFDMRHVGVNTVKLYGNRLARCVAALKKILPPSRANNQYCARDVNTFDRGDRYAFVNLQAYGQHKTLEVRGHSGTIDAKKILNWIKICDTVMVTRIRSSKKKIELLEDLQRFYNFDANLVAYMKERNTRLYGGVVPQAAPSEPNMAVATGTVSFDLSAIQATVNNLRSFVASTYNIEEQEG